jgi:hypothetical protein
MVELITIFITALPGNMTLHETRVVSPIVSDRLGAKDIDFCKDVIIPNILKNNKREPDRKLLSVTCKETIKT